MDREAVPDPQATAPQVPPEARYQDQEQDDGRALEPDEGLAQEPGGPARERGGPALQMGGPARRRDQDSGSGDGRDGLRSAGHPLYAGLTSDPRMPIWIGRAVASAVAGAIVLIWANWKLGLTVAAVVAIADTIYRSRTTAVIPASVRVTSAQRRTRRRLAALRMNGYVTLNARTIPGSEHVIDHLVIGPAGVFALDSERWDRRLPVRTSAGNEVYHGPFSQRDRLEHARWEAAQASRLLGEAAKRPVAVRAVMVIYGPRIPWTVVSLLGVDVLSGSRLRKYVRQQARARKAEQLDSRQVSVIQDAADRALPAVSR